jgi:hypothetical protein
LNYKIKWDGNIKTDLKEIGPKNVHGFNFLKTGNNGVILCVCKLARHVVSQFYDKMMYVSYHTCVVKAKSGSSTLVCPGGMWRRAV